MNSPSTLIADAVFNIRRAEHARRILMAENTQRARGVNRLGLLTLGLGMATSLIAALQTAGYFPDIVTLIGSGVTAASALVQQLTDRSRKEMMPRIAAAMQEFSDVGRDLFELNASWSLDSGSGNWDQKAAQAAYFPLRRKLESLFNTYSDLGFQLDTGADAGKGSGTGLPSAADVPSRPVPGIAPDHTLPSEVARSGSARKFRLDDGREFWVGTPLPGTTPIPVTPDGEAALPEAGPALKETLAAEAPPKKAEGDGS